MRTYRVILEETRLAHTTTYIIRVTDQQHRGQTVLLEVQAKDYQEAQKMIHFEKNINGKPISI